MSLVVWANGRIPDLRALAENRCRFGRKSRPFTSGRRFRNVRPHRPSASQPPAAARVAHRRCDRLILSVDGALQFRLLSNLRLRRRPIKAKAQDCAVGSRHRGILTARLDVDHVSDAMAAGIGGKAFGTRGFVRLGVLSARRNEGSGRCSAKNIKKKANTSRLGSGSSMSRKLRPAPPLPWATATDNCVEKAPRLSIVPCAVSALALSSDR
jgi:hypothetical protein